LQISNRKQDSSGPPLADLIGPINASKRGIMKRFLTAFVSVLLLAPSGFAREQSLLARVTVYWASGGRGSDRWTRRHVCSTGVRLAAGHCAVDPRRIPYGSRVILPDATLLAVDTGSAVVSRKAARRAGRTAVERSALVIDRFFETKQQALSWAGRNPYFMLVRVSPPNVRTLVISQALQPLPAPVSNSAQQLVTAPPQMAPAPRRSLDERPKLSSRYAR
jgi:3D (Asp-Asp-Asp) domain-containing protein